MDLKLRGSVAVITGGSRGIGRSIALSLAQEGAHVALCAREAAALEATANRLRRCGGEVLVCCADVGEDGAVEGLVKATVERWGRLDVLVNNAGGPPLGTFESFGDADWQSAFELTLMSVVRSVRAALPYLRAAAAGCVINTSVKQPIDGLLLSNSLRSAVAGLAKTLSRELGGSGVTVNNVCPAHILTGRLRQVAAYREAAGGAPVNARTAMAGIPLQRFGAPGEVADLVAFLASGRAGYITGTTIPVDGGSTSSLT
jgi:3-oxoacyl-[acyl-carrier protein] reductase